MFKILHITIDDKFFDEVYETFEKDKRLYNEALLIVPRENYIIRRIKSVGKITIMWNKDLIKQLILGGNYNALFFHSLSPSQWWLFDYIPDDKIVIWWAFGFDLYYSNRGLKPLVDFDLYKDKTKLLYKTNKSILSWLHFILYHCCIWSLYLKKQTEVLRRIDYFIPVLPLEFSIMTETHAEFNAKELYFKNKPITWSLSQKDPQGHILIGNSATYSNNHLDVWDVISKSGVRDRRLVVPLSYGIRKYASKLKLLLTSENNEVVILNEIIPIDDYTKILNACSYAIYGVIRQQATWNIYHCLLNGIKVFLYRDSIVYCSLKELGYAVYTIEDINSSSFCSPLTEQESNMNIEVYRKQLEREYNIYEHTIRDFTERTHVYNTHNESL
ncbi:MAG: TDP-N-acetylfucosamine:lipid II N-acetylfucosaminyltransferase [Bacteroidales bacterium]|nr:TDP-N-acetylfucosamine:lipid II N-acetylfucosaminyltransferase [Bacteroidales bacterium]